MFFHSRMFTEHSLPHLMKLLR